MAVKLFSIVQYYGQLLFKLLREYLKMVNYILYYDQNNENYNKIIYYAKKQSYIKYEF